MRGFNKKRLLIVGGAATTIGAAAVLVAGTTFGFFSSAGTTSGNNQFTAGTVVVGLDPGGTQVTCDIDPMSPGDTQASGSNVACRYDVKYTGNVPAFLAVDLRITGAPGSPIAIPYTQTTAPTAAQGLYDGTANGLQFSITDGSAVNYMSGVSYKLLTGVPTTLTPSGGTATVLHLLMNATPVAENATKSLTVNYTLPTTAGNAYNLATSTLTMTVHAVQADNNPLPGGCTAAGNQCLGLNWS